MNRIGGLVRALALTMLSLVSAGFVHAQGLSEPIILVASEDLDGTPFAQTVIFAAPVPGGGHIGFIVNRPTDVKLETVLPDQASARVVTEPVYLGGPRHTDSLFVLARSAPDDPTKVITLLPGLVAGIDEDDIDRILEKTPNEARYFVGMFVWAPDQLENEVGSGRWGVKPADPAVVFRKQPARLWTELRATSARGGPSGTWL